MWILQTCENVESKKHMVIANRTTFLWILLVLMLLSSMLSTLQKINLQPIHYCLTSLSIILRIFVSKKVEWYVIWRTEINANLFYWTSLSTVCCLQPKLSHNEFCWMFQGQLNDTKYLWNNSIEIIPLPNLISH